MGIVIQGIVLFRIIADKAHGLHFKHRLPHFNQQAAPKRTTHKVAISPINSFLPPILGLVNEINVVVLFFSCNLPTDALACFFRAYLARTCSSLLSNGAAPGPKETRKALQRARQRPWRNWTRQIHNPVTAQQVEGRKSIKQELELKRLQNEPWESKTNLLPKTK